jgi:hypothetical protein
VLEDNVVNNTFFEVKHGSDHVSFRDNVVTYNDGVALSIDGWDWTYNRGVTDLSIVNNTGYNAGAIGSFFRLWGPGAGITLDSNLYVAPNLVVGAYSTAPVYITPEDLSSFNEIRNNLWPIPAQRTWWANGGVNVQGSTDEHLGYKDESAWNAIEGIKNDVFMNVTPASGFQYILSGIVYGADLTHIG